MTQEKRRALRYDIDVSAEVYTTSGTLWANTRNLSNTGVCLDLNEELQEGAIVGLCLFLVSDGIEDPDSEPLNIKASVVWSSPREDKGYSSGLRFDSSDEVGRSAISRFLLLVE
jgi:hypothetical protein